MSSSEYTSDGQEEYILRSGGKLSGPVDTLKIKLNEFEDKIKTKYKPLIFLGIFLTIFLTVLTCDFKEIFGISSDTWQTFFIILLLLVGIYLIKSTFEWYPNRNLTIDTFLDELLEKEKRSNVSGESYESSLNQLMETWHSLKKK